MVELKPLPYVVEMMQAKGDPRRQVFRKEMKKQVQEMTNVLCSIFN